MEATMTLLERVKHLCKEKGVTQGKWKKISASATALLQNEDQLAQYGDSAETRGLFFRSHRISDKRREKRNSSLSERDRKDIARDLNNIMEKLSSGEDGPASYDGEPLSPNQRNFSAKNWKSL